MRDLYATSVQLVHVGGGNAFDIAVRRTLKWAFERVDSEPPNLSKQPVGVIPATPSPHEASVAWVAYLDGAIRAVEVRLRHPDADDASLTWQATATISEADGQTRATVRLERGASVYVLRPSAVSLRAPRLISDLIKAPLLAYVGTLELSAGVRTLQGKQAADFVDDVLRAPGRALPVIIAQRDVSQPLTRALARSLAGLAQVVRGGDAGADRALRDKLRTDGLDVPGGGFRLFWPGLDSKEEQLRHPYWTRAQIVGNGHPRSPSVIDQVVKLLAPISTGRVPSDPAVLQARRERLRRRLVGEGGGPSRRPSAQTERGRPSRRLTKPGADDADKLRKRVAQLEQDIEAAQEERDDALKRVETTEKDQLQQLEEAIGQSDEVDELKAENSRLMSLNNGLRANVDFLVRYTPDGDADSLDGDAEPPAPAAAPQTWDEVKRHLPDLKGPGFELTEKALKCANDKSRYPNPDAIWESMVQLEGVGRRYNELRGQVGMRFDDFARQTAGLNIALQDASYSEGCWFKFEREWRSRLPHVKIDDAKAPNEVGRIYFAIDSDKNRLIVDWFGTKPDRPETRRG